MRLNCSGTSERRLEEKSSIEWNEEGFLRVKQIPPLTTTDNENLTGDSTRFGDVSVGFGSRKDPKMYTLLCKENDHCAGGLGISVAVELYVQPKFFVEVDPTDGRLNLMVDLKVQAFAGLTAKT